MLAARKSQVSMERENKNDYECITKSSRNRRSVQPGQDSRHLGRGNPADGYLELDRFSANVARFRVGPAWIGRHESDITHTWFDLAVCPLHDHCPPRGRRSGLGDGQAEAPTGHLTGPKNRRTAARLWLWVVPALIGIALLDVVLASTIDNLWVSFFPVFAEPPGYSFAAILIARNPGTTGGRLVVLGPVCGILHIQHHPRGRISIPRRASAQDGRCFWQVELGSQRCTVWFLSPSPALEHSNCYRWRCLVLHTPGMALPQYLDVHHRPLCTKCVFCLPSPWCCVRVGVGIRAIRKVYSLSERPPAFARRVKVMATYPNFHLTP